MYNIRQALASLYFFVCMSAIKEYVPYHADRLQN